MSRRKLALLGVTVVGLSIVVGGVWYFSSVTIDDPGYFCQATRPSPDLVAASGSSAILQGCDAGRTITVAKGETVAMELPIGQSIDRGGTVWSEVTVSDPKVLSTITPPERVTLGSSAQPEEVAIFLASQTGQATLSAVSRVCSSVCSRGLRWKVTIRVI